MTNPYLEMNDEVSGARHDGRAVVALESTIITHGMPYPRNVETALAVEATIRDCGAAPATVVVLDGKLRVGVTADELDRIGQPGADAVKLSRRDLAFSVVRGGIGGTTVAATMIVASMAGIRVFATGGIGGVHRGAGDSFDISADLQELARTDVVVVCAGIKSILDIGLTLEYLETHGVPVIGYGTDMLPAFYTRESSFGVDYRIDDAEGVAQVMVARTELAIAGGMIVANPIPAEHSVDRATIDSAVDVALGEAAKRGVTGKDTTPFLLERVVELTGNVSLDANVELVLNNARVAADIAVAHSTKLSG